jgi:hypothetical protein
MLLQEMLCTSARSGAGEGDEDRTLNAWRAEGSALASESTMPLSAPAPAPEAGARERIGVSSEVKSVRDDPSFVKNCLPEASMLTAKRRRDEGEEAEAEAEAEAETENLTVQSGHEAAAAAARGA